MNITSMIFLINETHLPDSIDRMKMTDKLTSIYQSQFPDIEFECKFVDWQGVETGRLTGWSGDEELFAVNQYTLSYQGERASHITSIELWINALYLPPWIKFHNDRNTLNSQLAKMCKHIFCAGYDPSPKKLNVVVKYMEWHGPEICHLFAFYNDQQAFYINNVSIDRELTLHRLTAGQRVARAGIEPAISWL